MPEQPKRYVVGFLFSNDWGSIALLRKQKDKPGQEWQGGKLNGIGGHVEDDEDYSFAMRREGREEAKVTCQWKYQGQLIGKGWELGVFYAQIDLHTLPPENDVGEIFEICILPDILFEGDIVDNLRYLIPLCQDEAITFTISDTWIP